MVKILCLNIGGNPKKTHSDGIEKYFIQTFQKGIGLYTQCYTKEAPLTSKWCGPVRSKPINIKWERYTITPPLKTGVDVRHA